MQAPESVDAPAQRQRRLRHVADLFWDVFSSTLSELNAERLAKARRKQDDYADQLEKAADTNTAFKYLLLINVAALDGYIAQTRLQAQASFRLCKRVALGAFLLIIAGIGLGLWSMLDNRIHFKVAELTALSGVATQLVSSVFFALYNRTLQQFNVTQDKLATTQELTVSLLANSSIGNADKRDDCLAETVRLLLNRPRTQS